MIDLHRKTHSVSHFQVSLIRAGANLSEFAVGGTLVNFSENEINVATAWDDNGSVSPEVEIVVTGMNVPPGDGFPPLSAVASGPFNVGRGGIEAGNWISGDVATVAIAEGRYWVLVLLDTLEPMTARRVQFHFWPQST